MVYFGATTYILISSHDIMPRWRCGWRHSLPEVILLNRWDSIFYMLNRLLALRLAIECFLSLPAQKDLADFKMMDMEWFVLQEFENILDVNVYSFPLVVVR